MHTRQSSEFDNLPAPAHPLAHSIILHAPCIMCRMCARCPPAQRQNSKTGSSIVISAHLLSPTLQKRVRAATQVRAWRRERDPGHAAREAEVADVTRRLLEGRRAQKVGGGSTYAIAIQRTYCMLHIRIHTATPAALTAFEASGEVPAAPGMGGEQATLNKTLTLNPTHRTLSKQVAAAQRELLAGLLGEEGAAEGTAAAFRGRELLPRTLLPAACEAHHAAFHDHGAGTSRG